MGGGCLLASDYEPNHENSVSMEEILTYANQSQAINKIIILDAGFMGSYASSNLSQCNLVSGVTVLAAFADYLKEPWKKNDIKHGLFTNLPYLRDYEEEQLIFGEK